MKIPRQRTTFNLLEVRDRNNTPWWIYQWRVEHLRSNGWEGKR